VTEPPLAFRIVNWIAIIDQLASTEANRVLRPLGLQLPQFVLLNHFSHRPDEAKTVTSVARALQQPQPGVTKTVQKLVAKGWLRERSSEGDGRSKLLVLTPAGIAKHRAAVAALSPGLERAFAGWSQDDRRALFALLDRVKVWFDQDRDRAPPQATRRQS
jgi:DNA-binding MarR family transcriptional regulator